MTNCRPAPEPAPLFPAAGSLLTALADLEAALEPTASPDDLVKAARTVLMAAHPLRASPAALTRALTDAAVFRRYLRECLCDSAPGSTCSFDQRNQQQAALYESLLPTVAPPIAT